MDFRIDGEPMGARLGRPNGFIMPARFELVLGDSAFNGIVEVVSRGNRIMTTLEVSQGTLF
ncbi:hypothetical protein [Marinobacter sp. NSM]|uniref:hypothetical protein n=1 Tax=Marinobacter sp. NSM TaxID=3458004 RepID=UPI0040359C7A